jgi:hypothetical protein
MEDFKFEVGQEIKKVTGNYYATGVCRGLFRTSSGEKRVVMDFHAIPGLLHILSEKQLEPLEEGEQKDISNVDVLDQMSMMRSALNGMAESLAYERSRSVDLNNEVTKLRRELSERKNWFKWWKKQ